MYPTLNPFQVIRRSLASRGATRLDGGCRHACLRLRLNVGRTLHVKKSLSWMQLILKILLGFLLDLRGKVTYHLADISHLHHRAVVRIFATGERRRIVNVEDEARIIPRTVVAINEVG